MKSSDLQNDSTPAGRLNRRHFLAATAMASAFTILPRHVLGGPGRNGPNEKLNIAGIGIGGMGAANLQGLASQNIVALCDVDHDYAAKTFQQYPNAKRYTDFREMLEKQKDIEAVVIATPDHTHAIISMAAMKAGKHVYCQKPLTHDVNEARLLAKAAKELGVVTQMGIQGHSTDDLRSVCEWIWDGAIGEVREVDAWCSLSYYPWGHAYWSSQCSERPKETPPVPANLNWDLWLGPAPQRPYHRAYHPGSWRCWWDFGCGMMGDRGAHTLDVVNWSLKLGPPSRIEATSCGLTAEVHPLSAIVTFQFPARENLPPVKLTWYEGTRPPRPEDMDEDFHWPAEGGALFKGSKGKLICGVYAESPKLLPLSRHLEYKRPARTLPRVPDHSHELEWVRAIKEGRQANAGFEYSGPLTETCLLGNVAKRVDGQIEWDAPNLKVTNSEAANRLIRTQCRAGWSL
ncbi:MAG TPA: Gfo/Idh/MocA family oxidoreductase [Candidatus Sulfotelmatobacter sp.]|nr:Gfo/Idh/MocA family oxidoreductase [Candidatus Sulfotelmatobacter sp.]